MPELGIGNQCIFIYTGGMGPCQAVWGRAQHLGTNHQAELKHKPLGRPEMPRSNQLKRKSPAEDI